MAEAKTTRSESAAADPYADLAVPAEGEILSRDARHSTYKQVDPSADVNPPPGPMVEQTLGKAKEATD